MNKIEIINCDKFLKMLTKYDTIPILKTLNHEQYEGLVKALKESIITTADIKILNNKK